MEERFFTTGLHVRVFKSSDKPRIFLSPPTCSEIDRDRRRAHALSRRARPPAAIDSVRPRDRPRSLARTRPRRDARVSDRSPVGVARAIGTAASVPRGGQRTPHVLEHVQEVLALPVAVPRGRAPGKARGGVRRQRARRREQKEASRDARGGDGGGARGGRWRAPRRSDARASESPLRARTRVPSRARRRERLGDEPDRLG